MKIQKVEHFMNKQEILDKFKQHKDLYQIKMLFEEYPKEAKLIDKLAATDYKETYAAVVKAFYTDLTSLKLSNKHNFNNDKYIKICINTIIKVIDKAKNDNIDNEVQHMLDIQITEDNKIELAVFLFNDNNNNDEQFECEYIEDPYIITADKLINNNEIEVNNIYNIVKRLIKIKNKK